MVEFAVLALLLISGVEPTGTPLTLAEALARAEQANPELLAARERAAAQAERAESVARTRLPRLGLASGWSRTDNPSWVFSHKLTAGEFTQDDFAIQRLNAPASISHLTTTLGLQLPLDVFGKLGDQAAAQRASGRAALALAGEAHLETRTRVVEAYRRAAVASQAVGVTERALEGARARETDVEARVVEGAALQADLLRARARRRQREADLAERRADAALATAALSRLLGGDAGARYIAIEDAAAPAPLLADEAALVAQAPDHRPAVAAAEGRLAAARRAARLEGRGRLPDLVGWGQLQDDRNSFSGGGQSYAVGAELRWSAFDPGRGRRSAAAEADVRAAEHEARAARDQVQLEVRSAFRRAVASRERHRAAAGGAEEGREALRVVQERRRAGLATLTDELETEATSLAAELEEVRTAAEAAIADAQLERAAGSAFGTANHRDTETQRN